LITFAERLTRYWQLLGRLSCNLKRLFYWPVCFIRACEDSEFVGWFPEFGSGLEFLGRLYRTKCPYCGRSYVRNTNDPDARLLWDELWEKLWKR